VMLPPNFVGFEVLRNPAYEGKFSRSRAAYGVLDAGGGAVVRRDPRRNVVAAVHGSYEAKA